MDFQKMLDAICDAGRHERSKFMLNIGDLIDACVANPSGLVVVGGGWGLGKEHSYRGYYNELAFKPVSEPTASSEVHTMCQRALVDTYEGYKGGDYRYDRDTPIWFAAYGGTGSAFVGITVKECNIHLTTKDVD